MATISSPGIGSGLDIKSIVSQLVAIEKQPLTNLQVKAATVQTKISAYGEIKSLMSQLSDAASKLRSLTTYTGVAATSSSTDVASVSAIGGTGATSFSVTVGQVAKAQSFASASVAKVNDASDPLGTGKLVIQPGSYDELQVFTNAGDPIEIDVLAGETLADVALKINSENSGVSATVMNDGSGERLLLRSNETGATSGFEVSVVDDDGNLTDDSGLSRLLSNGVGNAAANTQYGQDAEILVNGSIPVTSATNTFANLVSGVTLTLSDSAANGDVTEVRVADDSQPVRAAVEGFVAAYNALNSMLTEATKYDAGTKSAGLLQGDSFAIGIQNSLRGMLQSTTVAGSFSRLADIGVSAQLDGSLQIDAAKFSAALKKPEDLESLFRVDNTGETTDGFALKFKRFADGLLNADGLFKSKEDSLKRVLDQNTKDQARLNEKVSRIEAQLSRRYSALDAQISSLTALNNYVAQQVTLWNKSSD